MVTTEDSRVAVEAQQKAVGSTPEKTLAAAAVPTPSHGQSGKAQQQRQSFAEEVKGAAEESMQEVIKNAERSLTKVRSLIEDHFHIDEVSFRVLGPLQQDSNLARDVHDCFNLVALVPVTLTNLMNWTCYPRPLCGLLTGRYSIPELWHGESFQLFWWATFSYFFLDLLFIVLLPKCVRSPRVIIQHHVATLAYILAPLLRPQLRFIMGACMSVEINTWFLIARRSFNKRGDRMFAPGVPLRKSLGLLLVSISFYVSWFAIRLGLYPYLLVFIIEEWYKESTRVGSPLNLVAFTPVMQCVFIFLNVKWTVDLVRSKLKGGRTAPSKGL